MTTPRVREILPPDSTHGTADWRPIIVGTLVTGFYVIHEGSPIRLSPVFRSRADARSWLAKP